MEFETQSILGHNKNFLKLTKLIKKIDYPIALFFKELKVLGRQRLHIELLSLYLNKMIAQLINMNSKIQMYIKKYVIIASLIY